MATRKEINDEFYAGYGDQPRGMTLMDYLSPSSYIDPYQSLRNPPQAAQQMDAQGFRQLSPAEANTVYDNPRYNPNLSANAQYDKLFGGNQAVATVENRGSMPSFNLGNLTNYIPSASTIGEYIPTSLPNVFGVNNPLYAGLLGADQSQALSKQSNVAGLLGAAAALVQGMGKQGGRRSAAQNIISALGAGYGSAGQAYQQGLQNYSQTQQLALQQRQQAAIEAMKLKYPEYADEIAANPSGAFRLIAESQAALNKPVVLAEGATLVKPSGEVLFSSTKTKPQARMLTADEIAAQGLPTSGGQKYQVDANGKIDLIQGTAPNKPATSIEEFQFYQSQGGKKSYENFMKDKTPSTSVTVNTGELSKGTKGKVEEGVLSSAEAVGRLNNIYSSYKPEYLNIPFRLKQEWSGLASKFKDIPETDKRILAGYSTFKQNALQNLNKTIKDLTGAAMGVQEADRIIASLPNAGTTVFGGDSPQEFESKLDNAIQQTKYALARQNYALKQGISKDAWEKIDLSDMPTIVEKRADEIAKAYKLNKNNPKDRQTIKRQVAAEFGIPF